MPPPVRRKTLVLVLAFGAALAVTTVAYAGNGGFAPLTPHSPNARRINDAYVWISIFSGAIFVLVEGTLLWFVFRYRRRGRARSVEGPQIHGATRLELIWTAIPVLILAAVASFVFYKLPGIQDVPAAKAEGGPVRIQVNAHQFYWQFTYPDGSISIDELHAPVNRTVRVDITSQDVDHSWWVPELGGKFDAIPGHRTHTWFKADQLGTYRGRCGEFCGVFHAAMKAVVDVQTQAEYTAWLGSAAGDLGRSEWAGACAKCHGLQGEGDYGPKISNNALLTQAQGLEQLIRNGKNKMPPVARGWSEEQVRALVAYLKQKVYKGTPSGG
ncbi:MAG: cytochrome c oxidase subunit II [Actinobacteria bacterium]|nr:MAG: cytochrome c oxidase subunit II [Actinomycetota bacterium]